MCFQKRLGFQWCGTGPNRPQIMSNSDLTTGKYVFTICEHNPHNSLEYVFFPLHIGTKELCVIIFISQRLSYKKRLAKKKKYKFHTI